MSQGMFEAMALSLNMSGVTCWPFLPQFMLQFYVVAMSLYVVNEVGVERQLEFTRLDNYLLSMAGWPCKGCKIK